MPESKSNDVMPSDDLRKIYQVPTLLSYGSFQAITLGATGTKNDGPGRNTKQSVAL